MCMLAMLAVMVFSMKLWLFVRKITRITCIFPQTAPLVVPDQKVIVGASLMRWLKLVVMRQLNTETGGTCRHYNAQVSRGHKWGFRSERFHIDVRECRVVERHTCAWRLRNHKKYNSRWEIHKTWVKRRYSSIKLVSVAPYVPREEGVCCK